MSISQTFARLRATRRTGLVTFVTAGDPDAARSARVLQALDRGGADILEVGVPFSDPLADGPVIQRASERALRAGTTLASTLDLVAGVRRALAAPVVLFTYDNPVFRMGTDAFIARARAAGVDGVLVLDLPIEESRPTRDALVAAGLIRFSAESDDDARAHCAGRRVGSRVPVRHLSPGRDGRACDRRRGRRRARGPRAGTRPPADCARLRPLAARARRRRGAYADAAVVGSALVD